GPGGTRAGRRAGGARGPGGTRAGGTRAGGTRGPTYSSLRAVAQTVSS
ncbi:MAG: hypothetical protein JWR04_477, partial [Rhodoglobus sp.]|nr:hypothetical protein [Rhodoglobus sp.]